jgi:hypothetical protein
MTSKDDIRRWFKQGVADGATHMIVVCDTYDYDDYPVYVAADQDVREVEKKHSLSAMQKVMEVYNLSLPMDNQLEAKRAFNY